jgi:GntR family transcriptional regulator
VQEGWPTVLTGLLVRGRVRVVRVNPNDPRPPFLQVAEDLTAAIKDSRLARGAQLPSIRQLADDYSVSAMTIQHALRLLRERKHIVSWQGRGSFVCETQPDDEPGTSNQQTSQPAESGEVTYQEMTALLADLRTDVARLNDRVADLESKVDKL